MKELTIPIQQNTKIPIYEQIYEYIKTDIIDGKISTGEKLPSTRLLAKHLQVSRSTVELSYEQLLSEGYVESIPGSGYYVRAIEFLTAEEHRERQMKSEQSDPAVQTQGEIRYDFSPNAIEWSDFSMNAWRKATKSMLQEPMEELFLSGMSQGEENLRHAISDYLHQSRGVNCGIEQIVIGAGNEYLLLLLHQMMDEKDGIAMESPTYRQAGEIFQNLGWKVKAVPTDESGMCPKGLEESGMELAYIMPSHQFPLGIVMPMGRRLELLSWAGERAGRYIIEDDYDSEFRYKGKPIPSLQGSDPYGRVIYLGTFSKSIAPAIRVSYMVLPPQLVPLYREKCGLYSSTVSRIQQQTLYHFLKDGYFERHLNKMRGIYRSRHDTLLAELKKRAWVKQIFGENAGLHILVEVDTDLTEEVLIELAKSRKVRVYGLLEYSILQKERERPVILILGYAGLTEEQIREGIAVLDNIIVNEQRECRK